MFEPYARFGLDGLSPDDLAAVRRLETTVTRLRNVSQNPNLKVTRALPGGGFVTTFAMGGIQKSIVQSPEQEDARPVEWATHDPGKVPMLFSGVVNSYYPNEGGQIELEVSEWTRRRLTQYGKAGFSPARQLVLSRFNVQHDARLDELRPKAGRPATQYLNARPTWYSGAMAEVVQIVGGYGCTDMQTLPDDAIERATLTVPAEVVQAWQQEFGRHVLPGYTGVPPKDGKIKYDYKPLQTHLVSFDDRGAPWLLEMRTTGVWAMPLPLVPVTTSKAFRDWIEEQGDSELLAILDRFGGLPTGERFPAGEHFERWRRAGAVIKVCDMNGAHSHLVYSPANGWTMNARGTEAFCTCYDYNEEGVGYGMLFKGLFTLQAAGHHGWAAPLDWLELGLSPQDQKLALEYASGIAAAAARARTDQKKMAAWFKLNNLEAAELVKRARAQLPVDQAIDELDNYEADPIAAHSGTVSEVHRGWLYHPARFEFQPQIKLPDVYEEMCVSHDFSILEGGNRNFAGLCDTVMWAYFVGDDLKVVKYFYTRQGAGQKTEDDFDECMIVGSWTQTISSAGRVQCHFYHTDFDEREVMPDTQTVTKLTGKDLGYSLVPGFEFDFFFATGGTIYRNRYYSWEVETIRDGSQGKNDGCVVPYFGRNAALYYLQEWEGGGRRTQVGNRYWIRDPYSYRMHTYDFVFHWVGSYRGPMHGQPPPKEGQPVWAELEQFGPTLCNDFANSGPWMSMPEDVTWLVHPDRNRWVYSQADEAPPYKAYSLSEAPVPVKYDYDTRASILAEPQSVHKRENPEYLLACPSDELPYFYRDSTKVVFGETEYANVSEYPDPGSPIRKFFGQSRFADHKRAHHFIGVIDE